MFYSAATGGFYVSGIHTSMPDDAVQIGAEEYDALMAGQSGGRVIVPGTDGRPTLQDRPAPSPEEELAAERSAMRVSRFQARAALHNVGLLASVEAAVAAADPFVQIAWQDASEFRRGSPTIAALAAALGLTDVQLDDLFRAAALIEA